MKKGVIRSFYIIEETDIKLKLRSKRDRDKEFWILKSDVDILQKEEKPKIEIAACKVQINKNIYKEILKNLSQKARGS